MRQLQSKSPFTGETGTHYGYSDGWQPSGLFFYTGEGQIGDMELRAGNKAIHMHIRDGKDLYLFEQAQRAHVRYLGQFVCTGDHEERSPDVKGNDRRAIVFELIPIEAFSTDTELYPIVDPEMNQSGQNAGIAELRAQATAAANDGAEPEQRLVNWRKRSNVIRRYVLLRANGVCEGCAAPAPFLTTRGEPYLEPHHIRRLSDGGPDDPRSVAGVCANCHRRAHYSVDAVDFNAHLTRVVRAKEQDHITASTAPSLASVTNRHVLPDVLSARPKALICGMAAGVKSAELGFYYAGPTNRFWSTLYEIGLTPTKLEPRQSDTLSELGIDLTDLAKTVFGNDSQIPAGACDREAFRVLVQRRKPRAVVFNGKAAAAIFYDTETDQLDFGLQPSIETFPPVFVLPSTSGSAIKYWNVSYWHEFMTFLRAHT